MLGGILAYAAGLLLVAWMTRRASATQRGADEAHRSAVADFAAVHNLVKMHSSIRMTPATKAGITNRLWSVGDLLSA